MFGLWPKSKYPEREQKSTVLSDLIALHANGAAKWSGRDAVSLSHSGYKRNVIVYRCVQMIAEAAASVPLMICDETGKLSRHPLLDLIEYPNPEETGQSLLESVYGHLQISGNAYLERVESVNGKTALYLLRPDKVKVDTGKDGWPRAYVIETPKGTRRIDRNTDGTFPVIHIRLFNPLDDQYGQSPLQVAGNAVDLHNTSVEWHKSLLDNAARPSGALIYRGVEGASNLTGDQFDRLKSELKDTFQGSHNAGRPMVLDGGLDWKPMSMSPAEMDFIRLKDGASRDIALAFGVPPMLLGIPGDNTYSNYQQARLAFWQQTILPLVGKVAWSLTTSLTENDVKILPDTSELDVLQEKRSSRLELLLSTEVLTEAEKRAALGYSAVPSEGDE